MIKPHEGSVSYANTFMKAYDWLDKHGPIELLTKKKTPFVVESSIVTRGPHVGEAVIIFRQGKMEYARSYECCWGHHHNCNRTRIGMYCSALDKAL